MRCTAPVVSGWSFGTKNHPLLDVTTQTMTLNASGGDMFQFYGDNLSLVEAGLLPKGSPDFYFQGDHQNSEVSATMLGVAGL